MFAARASGLVKLMGLCLTAGVLLAAMVFPFVGGLGLAARAGADSFGRIRGMTNLRVNDASLLPDAPGVNPQAAIMTIALRNAEHFLATT